MLASNLNIDGWLEKPAAMGSGRRSSSIAAWHY
jgi:hypothetical protein